MKGNQGAGNSGGGLFNVGQMSRGHFQGIPQSEQPGVRQVGSQGRLGHYGWGQRMMTWPIELFGPGRPGPVNASRSRPEMEQRGFMGIPLPFGGYRGSK